MSHGLTKNVFGLDIPSSTKNEWMRKIPRAYLIMIHLNAIHDINTHPHIEKIIHVIFRLGNRAM
jgi:hypothetical protein